MGTLFHASRNSWKGVPESKIGIRTTIGENS